MADLFSERYGELPTGSYDCVNRIVLNAYYPPGHNPGGSRVVRRWHDDGDETSDRSWPVPAPRGERAAFSESREERPDPRLR